MSRFVTGNRVLSSTMQDRIELRKALQTPGADGGFVRSYETLITLWAEVKQVSNSMYIRGVQAEANVTHEVVIRKTSLDTLQGAFSKAFSNDFMNVDIYPLKSEFFIFVSQGAGAEGIILRVRRIKVYKGLENYISFLCEELEQEGVGW